MTGTVKVAEDKIHWDLCKSSVSPPKWLEVVDYFSNCLAADDGYWKNNDRTFIFVQPRVRDLDYDQLGELLDFVGSCGDSKTHEQNKKDRNLLCS